MKFRPLHGHTRARNGRPSRTYIVWQRMHDRCTKPSSPKFHLYGGRGIKVCERWRDFAAFLADMGEVPDGFTLDRVDNDRGYEPENCRWATRQEQRLNQRGVRRFEWDGRMLSVGELAEVTGVNRNTLVSRLGRGWAVAEAVATPAARATGRHTPDCRLARVLGS
jgi:hypothetical protein